MRRMSYSFKSFYWLGDQFPARLNKIQSRLSHIERTAKQQTHKMRAIKKR